MKRRLEEEQPDYFEERGVDEPVFRRNFVREVCYENEKVYAVLAKKRIYDALAKQKLTEQIRKLNNGGDKFHPYL